MSELVDATGRTVRPPKRRGNDLATLNEVVNVVSNMTGPMAVVVQEMMVKIARLEDRLGITNESIDGEGEIKGTPYKCMASKEPEARVSEPTLPGGDVE